MLDCLMLDVGGTFVKTGSVAGGAFGAPGLFPIRESGTREEILSPMIDYIRSHPAKRIAVSMPGPMDYPTGTSHMKHKFVAIEGISLKAEFEAALPGCEVSFLHDAAAFLLGEAYEGNGLKDGCFAGSMLGTGLGFGMMRGGKLLMRRVLSPALPLWNLPFEGGIAEDYVSGRGIRRRWTEKTGNTDDVKEISILARQGNREAIDLFRETGALFGRMISEHTKGQGVTRFVVGGQIAKSWDLMAPSFAENCAIPALAAAHLDDAALRGAWTFSRLGQDALYDIVSD